MERIKAKFYGYPLIILLLASSFMQPAVARKGAMSVYAGTGVWNHAQEGELNHLGTDTEMEKDFGFEDDLASFAIIAVEHGWRWLPNIRISQYVIETEGSKTVTASSTFTFAGTAYTDGTAITSSLLWDETDALLYYNFPFKFIRFDLGLGVKQVYGEISVITGGVSNTLKIEETLPTAYVMVTALIPKTGLTFSVDKIQTFAGDSIISQTNIKLGYMTPYKIGIEAGYRTSSMKFDNFATIDGEIEFSGPFINMQLRF